MKTDKKTAIIISATSDIGHAMSLRWIKRGWKIYGTYRTESSYVEKLCDSGIKMLYCNLNDDKSLSNACRELRTSCPSWDILVLCPGAQEPVEAFRDCNFDEWEKSIRVNFTNQLRIVHAMLPHRNLKTDLKPCVLFFAGGGTNNAVVNYSAYTISKIALIKMCELLDAEIPDTRFTIVGPGWVKTKIHTATLNARDKAGDNFNKTRIMLSGNECTPMDKVLDCCDWLVNSSREIVGGRNFSVVYDEWGSENLEKMLISNHDIYKLRRSGNNLLIKGDR